MRHIDVIYVAHLTWDEALMDYLGIDIGGTQTKWAVIASDNSVTMRGSVPTDFRTTEDEMARLDGIMKPLKGQSTDN